jgi:Tol biopolymer transport system component
MHRPYALAVLTCLAAGAFDIWVMSLDGSQSTELRNHTASSPNASEQYQPARSPDGRRIALVECPWAFNLCSSGAVTVMNADGSGLVPVAVASEFAHPTWSPDGQLIANGTTPAWRPRN